jgi:hypothetical protein
MRGEQNRLDPVAGAQVEGTLALTANREMGKRHGRTMDARYVIGVAFSRAGVIGRNQKLVVRNDPRCAVHDLAVPDEKACFSQ